MKKLLLVINSIFLIFLLSSCNSPLNSEQAKAAMNTIDENEQKPKNIRIFDVVNRPTEFDYLTESQITKELDGYKISATYPCTEYSQLNILIEEMIYQTINDYIFNESKYDLNINYEISEYCDILTSFKFNIQNLTTNTIISVEPLVFNLNDGQNVSISEIFKPNINYLELLNNKIPDLKNNDFSRFAIDETNLIIYDNINSFQIPLKSIKNKLMYTNEEELIIGEDEKLIAITFDDGPSIFTTPYLLDGLAERDVKATFFMLGSNIKRYPDIVKRIYEEGHDIGNHSLEHKNMVKLDNNMAKVQHDTPNELLNSILGMNATFFRPPYGNFNDIVKSVSDVPIILWNIDPQDWKYKDANMVANHVIERAKDGDIVLLHDIYSSTVEAAFKIVDVLSERNFRFVTVNELLKYREYEPNAGEILRYAYKKQ